MTGWAARKVQLGPVRQRRPAQRAAAAIERPGAEGEQFVRSVFPAMIYQPWPVPVDVNKISFALRPDVDLDALAERFAGRAGIDSWSATGKGAEFGEIGQLGIHKGAAIGGTPRRSPRGADRWVDRHGRCPQRPGDVRRLRHVRGHGQRASADVQAAADLVTDHVDDDGLAKAFVRLGLIDA